MSSTRYSVGIIGLGAIAAMYGKPEDAAPYCHVGGIRHAACVRLAATADLSQEKYDAFAERWAGALPPFQHFSSHQDMLSEALPDIVAVCVRGPHHFAVTRDVIEAGPACIFLEKPPVCSLAEQDTLVTAATARKIPIVVSYSRHWAPHVLRLQELVRDGLIGEVKHVVGYTGGSFLSFGSHTTDLICQFAGYCPEAVYARGKFPDADVPAGFEVEPTIDSMTIEFANGVIGTQIGGHGEHGGFYVDVFGTKGSVRAGIYTAPVARDDKGSAIKLDMPPNASVFRLAYEQIAAYLDGGPLPHCCDADWIAVNEIGFAGIESLHTDTRILLPNKRRDRVVFANG